MPESMTIPPAENNEIVTTRVFPATCQQLYEAFSDPQRLRQWWGPKGFTNTFKAFEFQPGGTWSFTMHAPGGAEYHNESRFTEIVEPERIVFEHLEPVHWFQMTMTFAEEDMGARLTWRMRFQTSEEVMKLGRFITTANGENFDRLHAHLGNV